jgi:uncharacterized membrane protein
MAYDLLEYISLFGVVIVIGLVSALLYIYIQNYRQIKVTYGLGLILFATIIIIHNIIKIVRSKGQRKNKPYNNNSNELRVHARHHRVNLSPY